MVTENFPPSHRLVSSSETSEMPPEMTQGVKHQMPTPVARATVQTCLCSFPSRCHFPFSGRRDHFPGNCPQACEP